MDKGLIQTKIQVQNAVDNNKYIYINKQGKLIHINSYFRINSAIRGTLIATLPAGFRPPEILIIPVISYLDLSQPNSLSLGSIQINANGSMLVFASKHLPVFEIFINCAFTVN